MSESGYSIFYEQLATRGYIPDLDKEEWPSSCT